MTYAGRLFTVAGLLGLGLICPSAQAADVTALGDSMMKNVGRAIRKQYADAKAEVAVATSIGSGLARLDLYDWHTQSETLMAAQSPSLVFVMMGANDNQAMRTAGGVLPFGSPGWNEEYGRRVGRLMDLLLAGGKRRVVWIGMPRMREEKLDADVRAMEQIVVQQADARDRVTYFSTLDLLAPPGAYKAYITQANGMPLDVRSEDGIHLNRNGAEYLASLLLAAFPAKDLKSR
jgi:hypothetical protein